jgi:hypothetical protein
LIVCLTTNNCFVIFFAPHISFPYHVDFNLRMRTSLILLTVSLFRMEKDLLFDVSSAFSLNCIYIFLCIRFICSNRLFINWTELNWTELKWNELTLFFFRSQILFMCRKLKSWVFLWIPFNFNMREYAFHIFTSYLCVPNILFFWF